MINSEINTEIRSPLFTKEYQEACQWKERHRKPGRMANMLAALKRTGGQECVPGTVL